MVLLVFNFNFVSEIFFVIRSPSYHLLSRYLVNLVFFLTFFFLFYSSLKDPNVVSNSRQQELDNLQKYFSGSSSYSNKQTVQLYY